MLVTIIIFVVVLSLLVFVHELGHFIMARRSGMGVHEFGFGFPPRLFGIQKKDGRWRIVGRKEQSTTEATIYSINAIPIGGFVKILGEDNDSASLPNSFTSKTFVQRFLTLAAGVIMNILTAWIIFSIGFMIGLPAAVNSVSDLPSGASFSDQKIIIGEVKPGSVAEQAGLLAGDVIIMIDGQELLDISALQSYIRDQQGQSIQFEVKRLSETKVINVVTSAESNPAAGIVGIGLGYYGKVQFGPVVAVWQGAQTTVNQLGAIFTGLAKIFTTSDGVKSIGGPVKIAQLTGQVADLGILPLLQFTAFLSLNLAILNSLPFPALDGGRMLFLIIEKLRGRPNNQKLEQYANAIGFMALLFLMLIVTARDISQLESIKNLFS